MNPVNYKQVLQESEKTWTVCEDFSCQLSLDDSSGVDRGSYWLILRKKKTVIGRCNFHFLFGGRCMLNSVIIYKKFRGKGYGNLLLKEAIKKVPKMTLWVAKKNVFAQKFYAKHKFSKVGTDILGGEDQIIMTRNPESFK